MVERVRTRQVKVGGVLIGGGAPVSIQSMTATPTHEVQRTVEQICQLAEAGCDLVRLAVPRQEDTAALSEIVARSPVPIIADVHFHYRRALEAVEAGVHKIRLNPGNISDRDEVDQVIAACKRRGVAIRVGVNEGSIVERKDRRVRAAQMARLQRNYRAELVELMVDKLEDYVRIFQENDFQELVLSAKSSDPMVVIEACTAIRQRFDYPLHVGLTHAGPPETGRIRSIAAVGSLLSRGIGDTIRISYTGEPIQEVLDAKELLCCLGLRERSEPELIACPTCGRIEVDLVELVKQVRGRLADLRVPMKVAVMGCMVNGPGEAEGADVALFAGKGRAMICLEGRHVRTVGQAEMLDALYEQCLHFAERVRRGQARPSAGIRFVPRAS